MMPPKEMRKRGAFGKTTARIDQVDVRSDIHYVETKLNAAASLCFMVYTYYPSAANSETEDLDDIKEIRSKLAETGSTWDDNFIIRQLRDWKRYDLNIGVLGRSKAGKSSFINAIRGLKDTDDDAAAVDVVEKTNKVAPYKHPNNPKLIFWDLPGTGTLGHSWDDFSQQVNMDMFDFFLIFSRDGFTELETWMSKKIRTAKKRFYYIRSRVDIAIRNDKRDYPDTHNPKQVLETIKRDCQKQIQTTEKTPFENVFLISNKEPHKYEFRTLVNKITEEFPSLKKDALILSLSAFASPKMLELKRKICRKRAFLVSCLSAGAGAVPIPGLGAGVDIAIIAEEMAFYRKQFRVDDEAIKERAASLNITVDLLKSRYGLLSAVSITVKSLSFIGLTLASSTAIENVSRIVLPVVGSAIAAGVSYGTTMAILLKLIAMTYEDAIKLNKLMADKSGFEIEEDLLPIIDRSFIRSVAVLGEMGTGKSSLVNALRGVKAADPGAAKVGVIETTTEMKCYRFPDEKGELYELWDLPGTLTDRFPRDKYLKRIKYDSYDIFIICSSASFTETDMLLAKAISKLGRPFLLVRTKVNDDIESGDSSTSNDPSLVLSRILENYTTPLQEAGLGDTRVFIVETADPSAFDFPKLQQHLRHCVETCKKREKSCVIS